MEDQTEHKRKLSLSGNDFGYPGSAEYLRLITWEDLSLSYKLDAEAVLRAFTPEEDDTTWDY